MELIDYEYEEFEAIMRRMYILKSLLMK